MEAQITDLFSLQIYTEKGMYIGEVEDVVIDVDQKKIDSVVVGKVNEQLFELKNFKGLKIPYRIISAIDDIVLIRHLPGAFSGGSGSNSLGE
jgi:sporulation protein YlmC with PRC-barrel domain